jgi:hypothetical protein
MVKIKTQIESPLDFELVVWILHYPYAGYMPTEEHSIYLSPVGDWWAIFSGAERWFPLAYEREAQNFLKMMQAHPWRMHSRCRLCFNDMNRTLPI